MIRFLLSLALLLFLAEDPAVWSGSIELPGGQKIEYSVELQEDSGTITIPLQNVKDVALSEVSVTDKEIKFSIPTVGAKFELAVAADGKTAEGLLKQGGEFKTTLKRVATGEKVVKELKRPQDPKPPFPYDAVEVSFENAPAHATFAGTLTMPRAGGPFPCVVTVTGSGPQDRDEGLLGHRPFLVIADHLTRNGIAVLRYDDRGTAKSTGDFSTATTEDFAKDALAAVAFLKTRKEIDPKRIGILGHSEGGVVAPICAAESKDVAFIVLLAGTGMTGAELLPIQSKLISLATGTAPAEAEEQAKDAAQVFGMIVAGKSDAEITKRIHAAVARAFEASPEAKGLTPEKKKEKIDALAAQQTQQTLSPWFRRFMVLDPRENLKRVTCPVLAVNGSLDLQVPPKENLPRIERALKEGGNKDVTVIEFPGLNHLFQTCKTGSPTEYGEIEETVAPVALEAVTRWIRKRTKLD